MSLRYGFKYGDITQWAASWNAAVNPNKPDFFAMQAIPDGGQILTVSGPAAKESGAMLQGAVHQFPAVPFSTLETSLSIVVDNSPARGWIEIDTRLTTPDGLTYIGDLDIGVDGSIRVGDTKGSWHPTAVKILPLSPWNKTPLSILKSYDFAAKTSTVVSIKVWDTVYPIGMTFPAVNLGWSPNDALVEQHQIDQSPLGGTCMCYFGPTTVVGA